MLPHSVQTANSETILVCETSLCIKSLYLSCIQSTSLDTNVQEASCTRKIMHKNLYQATVIKIMAVLEQYEYYKQCLHYDTVFLQYTIKDSVCIITKKKKMELHSKNKRLLSMTHCPYEQYYMPNLNPKYFLYHSILHYDLSIVLLVLLNSGLAALGSSLHCLQCSKSRVAMIGTLTFS